MATINFPSSLGVWVRGNYSNTRPQNRPYLGGRKSQDRQSTISATFFMHEVNSASALLDWWTLEAKYGHAKFNVLLPFFESTSIDVTMINDLQIMDRGNNIYEAVCKLQIPLEGGSSQQPPTLDAPTAIIDLVASDTNVNVVITFTDPNSVQPVTYDLYGGGLLLASNITSGYEDIFGGTRDYYIISNNSGGATQSNIDSGTGTYNPLGAYDQSLLYDNTNISTEFLT